MKAERGVACSLFYNIVEFSQAEGPRMRLDMIGPLL